VVTDQATTAPPAVTVAVGSVGRVSRAVAPPRLSDDTCGARVRGVSIAQGGVAAAIAHLFDSSRGIKCILTTILSWTPDPCAGKDAAETPHAAQHGGARRRRWRRLRRRETPKLRWAVGRSPHGPGPWAL